MRQLEALGYMQGVTPAPPISGVTKNLPDRTWSGFNFYTSGHASEAFLMDMEGNIVHEWKYDFGAAIPAKKPAKMPWRRAYMYENGDILAVFVGHALIRIDRHSRLKWVYRAICHHDVFVTDDGFIYVLSRKAMIVPSIHETEPVQDDFIDVLDGDGNRLKRLSILECIRNSAYQWPLIENVRERVTYRLMLGSERPGDMFHTNTIEVFDGSQEELSPFFRKGNLLVSLREPGIVAIIDPEKEAVVWAVSGMWHLQHDPILLDNGRMLVFDNRGNRGFSRVIEFDPFSQEIRWIFQGDPPENFFSKECGAIQRLENGNTLIVESDNGRALEVAPDGAVVWEFVNPHRAGKNKNLIATLFDVVRIPKDRNLDWLEN